MLRDRITQHRFAIKHKGDTPVADHFAVAGHNPRLSVLQGASENVLLRRIAERSWILKLKSHPSVYVINRDDGIDVLTI